MIHVHNLTKRYGATTVVDGLTFTVAPGRVTGFLGPNGAGKSTTMRMILGLTSPTSGTATINGRRYRTLPAPLREVGALLDPEAAHPGRTARAHLLWQARGAGLPRRRVDEVLELVGLAAVAHQRIGSFSLGMRQRLGIASALLGDPAVLLFDEPVNGLDPEGIRWFRGLLSQLAAEGRTVLVSSHLMHEIQTVADHVIVIGRGRLLADMSMAELAARYTGGIRVVASDTTPLTAALVSAGAEVRPADGALLVSGLEAAHVGEIALRCGIALRELTPQHTSLEEVFMELTAAATPHRSGSIPASERSQA